jgi:hypothetical protein
MINLTLEELKEKLSRLDEVTLLELLNVDSEMLVQVFSDIIEDNQYRLRREIDE